MKAASLVWPRQQAFSIGLLPGQHRGRSGHRGEARKVQETKEEIRAEGEDNLGETRNDWESGVLMTDPDLCKDPILGAQVHCS